MARTLGLLVVLAAMLSGCSGQDVGDANKNPEPGTVSKPAAPGGGTTGTGAPEPKMALPK